MVSSLPARATPLSSTSSPLLLLLLLRYDVLGGYMASDEEGSGVSPVEVAAGRQTRRIVTHQTAVVTAFDLSVCRTEGRSIEDRVLVRALQRADDAISSCAS